MTLRHVLCRAVVGLVACILAAGSLAATTWEVTVSNFSFTPSDLQIRVGDSVHWTNGTGTLHTATADDGSFSSGAPSGNFSFTFEFTAGGTFPYHCTQHPFMTGTITVEPGPDTIVETLQAYEFESMYDGPIPYDANTPYLSRAVPGNASVFLAAGLHVPAGSLLTGLELEGCSSGPSSHLLAALSSCAVGDAACLDLGFVDTGLLSNDACFTLRANLAHTVNNLLNSYAVRVDMVSGNIASTPSFRAVRIFYKRQVAPAPGEATFADVQPSSLYFQYVEALALVGATTGCGGNNFCPDNPVTRAQLALILAKLMGLNPN